MSGNENTTGRQYVLWCGNSHQSELNSIPSSPVFTTFNKEEDIITAIGDHPITHMVVNNGVVPAFSVISPQLSHLEIKNIGDMSELHRLSSLTQLHALYLSGNDFHRGLPEVICQLTSLKTLDLSCCKLADLPFQLCNLNELNVLNLKSNKFTDFPTAIYQLRSLQELDMSFNDQLERIDERILELTDLTTLDCRGCGSLGHPPHTVCEQGLDAMKNYLKNLPVMRNSELIQASVALLGCSLSGKTSLRKSLQKRKRVLTHRNVSSLQDKTIRAFQAESLKTSRSSVRIIDYGECEVYHTARMLSPKSLCIPVFVVNVKEFTDLSETLGLREATRKVLFDWIAHLYMACPHLGPPLLVLTHTDRLSSVTSELKACLLQTAELLKEEFLEDENLLACEGDKHLQVVDHLSERELSLFHSQDVFEFGNDLQEVSNINLLMEKIEERCEQFTITMPELWNAIAESIDSQKGAYISLSQLNEMFDADDLVGVLRCMHNAGRIFYFEEIEELSGYVFHRVHAVAELFSLLFLHTSEGQWKRRMMKFTPFKDQGRNIRQVMFKDLIGQFTRSGLLDEALLVCIVQRSSFPFKLAVILLKSFYLLYGPLEVDHQPIYVLPSLSDRCTGNRWRSEDKLQLRLELVFSGTSLPEHIFQLMTVAALNCVLALYSSSTVMRDGVVIHNGDLTLRVVHNFNTRGVTLQVSTTVPHIGKGWKVLLKTTEEVYKMLRRVWRVCHLDVASYCAHCLFLQYPQPSKTEDPDWLYSDDGVIDSEKIQTCTGLGLVVCEHCSTVNEQQQPEVPKPLVYPCYQLTDDEVKKLERYFVTLSEQRSRSTENTGEAGGAAADSGSDISDTEVTEFADYQEPPIIGMRLRRTEDDKIRRLYKNAAKVYQMSDLCRGRVLIINNRSFSNAPDRLGSKMDYLNLCRLFKDLKFDIAKSQGALSNLTAQQMCREIEEETQREEHKQFGMFVLVVMSHGRDGHIILDRDCQPLRLATIQDLLSPSSFPAMKGKPKMIIVQACSGDSTDVRNVRALFGQFTAASPQPSTSSARDDLSLPHANMPAVQSPTVEDFAVTSSSLRSQLDAPILSSADDFFIMMAGRKSELSLNADTHGSMFIRLLVATFYRHACHRDVETLFNIIKDRVRQKNILHNSSTSGEESENLPASSCTFTKSRKLYFFPGVHPRLQ